MPEQLEENPLPQNKKDDEERVLPLDLEKEGHRFLLSKFSRWPVWETLGNATPKVLPKWEYPSEPKLAIQGGWIIWKYTLPQYFSSVTSSLKEKKGGGRRTVQKSVSNPVTISTGVKGNKQSDLEALEQKAKLWPMSFDLGAESDEETANNLVERCKEFNQHGEKKWPEDEKDALDVVRYRKARSRAIKQWREDVFRTTVLWESIFAALSISWHIWNRYDEHFGGDNEEDRLKYLTPFFEAVGINVERVWEIAFKIPYYGGGKGSASKPGKPTIKPITNYYRLKQSEKLHGKLTKREREKQRREYEAQQLQFANALEAQYSERRARDYKAFEAKYGKVSKSKLRNSPEYAASMQEKWDAFRLEQWNLLGGGVMTESMAEPNSAHRQGEDSEQEDSKLAKLNSRSSNRTSGTHVATKVKQKSNSYLRKKPKKGT